MFDNYSCHPATCSKPFSYVAFDEAALTAIIKHCKCWNFPLGLDMGDFNWDNTHFDDFWCHVCWCWFHIHFCKVGFYSVTITIFAIVSWLHQLSISVHTHAIQFDASFHEFCTLSFSGKSWQYALLILGGSSHSIIFFFFASCLSYQLTYCQTVCSCPDYAFLQKLDT